MKTLHRYILSELAGPFVVSLSLLTFILFMRHMVLLFPKIAGKNLGWPVIAELIVLSLPFIIALVLPMAVLVGVIMAFGRLSADNEITAMKALGVPAHRLMLGPLAAAGLLMLAAIWFNDRILPESNHRYKNLLMDIAYLKPTLKLREGVIMDDFGGLGILVNRIKEHRGRRNLSLTAPDQLEGGAERDPAGPAELFGVIITENPSSGARRTIVADSGAIRMTADHKDALLTLYHGEIQEVDPQRRQQFQRLFFIRHQIRLANIGGMFDRSHSSSYRSDRELTLGMIGERIAGRKAEADSLYHLALPLLDSLPPGDSIAPAFGRLLKIPTPADFGRLGPPPDATAALPPGQLGNYLKSPRVRLAQTCREARYIQQNISSLKVESWKKIAIPFACLVFVLLGVPLGIITRKGGAGVSISISMGVFLVYWVCLLAGETLADRLLISPFWAMWTPNALSLVLGFWLLAVQVRGRKSLAPAGSGVEFNLFKAAGRIFGKKSRRGERGR